MNIGLCFPYTQDDLSREVMLEWFRRADEGPFSTLSCGERMVGSSVDMMATLAAVLSAIMNNVGALALLMPAALQSAAKIKRLPAVTLMPLSFGSILGGFVTLIGTPPKIIVTAVREKATGTPFAMFDFTQVGAAVAVVGIVFIAVVGRRLIPKSSRTKMSQG